MLDCPENVPEDMACVPGGEMIRGTNQEHSCGQGENKRYKTQFGPETEIWVQTFLMDKTEVTYEAYQKCRQEKKCDYAHPSYGDFNRPNQPMMGASWHAAKKFCEVQGKRLPTEAEWEKAARGGEGAATPFDNVDVVTCDEAIIKDGSGRSCGVRKKGSHPEKGRVWEVALQAPGRYGLYDMVGNAEEWVSDWFAPSLEKCGENCRGTNPQGPCAGKSSCPEFAIRDGKALKMVKGGSWYWPTEDATGWHRRPHVPENKPYHHFGFRCAKDIILVESPSTEPENLQTPNQK
jgi:sulfatase modifying factor 1